jgi:hypothetical protein
MLWSQETPTFKLILGTNWDGATNNEERDWIGSHSLNTKVSQFQSVGPINKTWYNMVHSSNFLLGTSLVIYSHIFGGHKTFNSLGKDSHIHGLGNLFGMVYRLWTMFGTWNHINSFYDKKHTRSLDCKKMSLVLGTLLPGSIMNACHSILESNRERVQLGMWIFWFSFYKCSLRPGSCISKHDFLWPTPYLQRTQLILPIPVQCFKVGSQTKCLKCTQMMERTNKDVC